jgi:hypothetical protein
MNTDNKKVVYLLPDTNLFIQCRALLELDWTIWQDFDEVQLLVTRPVQREIDNHKSTGRGRVNKRARKASSLFREIILSSDKFKVVRKQHPRVTLGLRPEFLPDSARSDHLDYEDRDDRLVGTLSTVVTSLYPSNVFLLTHDTGPMATAQMLGLPFIPIPDDWLSEPEGNEADKRIRSLEHRLNKILNAEPRFEIACLDADGRPAEELILEHCHFEPLQDKEIESLMHRLRERFPMATDFGSKESSKRTPPGTGLRLAGFSETYKPADEMQIRKYTEVRYPDWLKECEKRLQRLHIILQREADVPTFCFAVKNNGARPARSALVTVSACGNFEILPPRSNPYGQDINAETGASLPRVPIAPKGQWQSSYSSGIADLARSFHRLEQMSADFGVRAIELPGVPQLEPFRRDPDKFYYKASRPIMPVHSFELECEQWRHGADPEEFWGEIHRLGDGKKSSGVLEFQIHAENLSESACLRVPVRIWHAQRGIYERAQKLVESLSST